MAKSYQEDRVLQGVFYPRTLRLEAPSQKAYMVPKWSQREASIIEPVTQATTVGKQSPSRNEKTKEERSEIENSYLGVQGLKLPPFPACDSEVKSTPCVKK